MSKRRIVYNTCLFKEHKMSSKQSELILLFEISKLVSPEGKTNFSCFDSSEINNGIGIIKMNKDEV